MAETETLLRELLSPQGLRDPYRVYREIHAAADVGRSAGRVLFRYDDVRKALQDRDLSSDRVSAILRPLPERARVDAAPLERTMRDILVFKDGMDHRRLRGLLARAFTPRTVELAKPAIAEATDRLLETLDGDGIVDLHRDLTYPLPAIVVAALLGVPETDRDAFRSWALDLVLVVGSGTLTPKLARRATTGAARMRELVARLVERRRAASGPDLLSTMIEAADDEDRLTPDELAANALFLMTAGHETATNMLSNAILTLLRHPEQRELLSGNLALLGTATEELLR